MDIGDWIRILVGVSSLVALLWGLVKGFLFFYRKTIKSAADIQHNYRLLEDKFEHD